MATPTDDRAKFLAAVEGLRPELHRYCARMVGSIVDGEDVVQDTLERAFDALPTLEEMPPLGPWLFRIAHHRAIDFTRRYERRMGRSLGDEESTESSAEDPEEALARAEATKLAVARFLELVPLQRSCVILKDVLGHSVDEITTLLESSEPAVKAALHRGREKLKTLASETPPTEKEISADLKRYAALFNAGDWDGLRTMLADDVRLQLPTKPKRAGKADVGLYFTNYERIGGVTVVPAIVDGEETLVAYVAGNEAPAYLVRLTLEGGKITLIRDYRYVPYIADEVAQVRK
ncbi:MAG TPA: sigma-70 family RNA polymerase sigma factor [Polyangiaceae bacterium]